MKGRQNRRYFHTNVLEHNSITFKKILVQRCQETKLYAQD